MLEAAHRGPRFTISLGRSTPAAKWGARPADYPIFAIDVLILLVLGYFFLDGLGDGTVSSFNIGLWLPLVCIPAGALWGGLRLKAMGRQGAGSGLLALVAVPGLLLGGFMLLLILLYATDPGAHH